MNPRIQRILAGIELFALVFWIGGLFCLTFFLPPLAGLLLSNPQDSFWQPLDTLFYQFNSVEIIFALVVLASNYVKTALFRKVYPLQQLALMVAALMLVFALTCSVVLRPRIETKATEILSSQDAPKKREVQQLGELYREYRTLMTANFMLGLFLVYSYRAFEERKYHAIAKLINLP